MTPDLLIGLWVTAFVVGLSLPLGVLLCWLGAWHSTSYV